MAADAPLLLPRSPEIQPRNVSRARKHVVISRIGSWIGSTKERDRHPRDISANLLEELDVSRGVSNHATTRTYNLLTKQYWEIEVTERAITSPLMIKKELDA